MEWTSSGSGPSQQGPVVSTSPESAVDHLVSPLSSAQTLHAIKTYECISTHSPSRLWNSSKFVPRTKGWVSQELVVACLWCHLEMSNKAWGRPVPPSDRVSLPMLTWNRTKQHDLPTPPSAGPSWTSPAVSLAPHDAQLPAPGALLPCEPVPPLTALGRSSCWAWIPTPL